VHEVAPSAQLELHAVSEGGKLRAELAVEAIDSCVASGVDAINLSLGVALSDDAYRSLLRAKLRPTG
jgi:hypothetical protein